LYTNNTELSPAPGLSLQSSFTHLTALQQEWLLTRRYYETDKACSLQLGRDGSFAANAKRNSSEFRVCYEMLIKGDPTLVDASLVDALIQSNVLKALIEERKILDFSWYDASDAKLGTAKAAAIRDAISRVRGSKHVEEHVFRLEEVMKVIEGEVVNIE
jgi:hypothetical protein